MTEKRTGKPRLRVAVSGRVRRIEVPSDRSLELLRYLRTHGVTASHPGPCYPGTDAIELGNGAETAAVQELLDRWA